MAPVTCGAAKLVPAMRPVVAPVKRQSSPMNVRPKSSRCPLALVSRESGLSTYSPGAMMCGTVGCRPSVVLLKSVGRAKFPSIAPTAMLLYAYSGVSTFPSEGGSGGVRPGQGPESCSLPAAVTKVTFGLATRKLSSACTVQLGSLAE